MLITNNFCYDLIGILTAFLAIAIAYYKWTFSYWKQKGFEGLEPSIPFGNIGGMILGKKHFVEVFNETYAYAKGKGLKYSIIFFGPRPCIIPTDIEFVKNIMQTDFGHFWGHGIYVNEEVDPLSANVFNLEGPKWKSMRTKLTPTFTSGKMKMMFQTLLSCSDNLHEILDEYCRENKAIEIKDIMARFTTDIIGSCAFGLDCNSMKNPNSEFRLYGMRAIKTDFAQAIRSMSSLAMPDWLLRLIRFSPNEPVVRDFFLGMVKNTVEYREKNNVTRKDFMDLLIKMKIDKKQSNGAKEDKEEGLTLNEIAAQSFIFFLAGFETSSTTLHCAAYELAVNPEIQDRLRQEIRDVLEKHNNVLTYDALSEMTYLDRTISETLRKYPALPVLFRRCNEDYTIPNTDKVIQKDTSVMVPIMGIHWDPEYYPDPEKFDPDRFTEENKAKRPPMTWLPFGDGPRICIGMRFGVMQTKIGLITLLKDFKVTVNKKTKIPLVLSKHGVLISFEGSLWFDLHKV